MELDTVTSKWSPDGANILICPVFPLVLSSVLVLPTAPDSLFV